MNGPLPNRTADLMEWLRGTYGLIAADIGAGRALSKDLRKCMGLMEALRIDTRPEVMQKARAIDGMCVFELTKRRLTTERSLAEQLEDAAALFAESSTDVAAGIDREIEEMRAESKSQMAHPCFRIFHRICRRIRRIAH